MRLLAVTILLALLPAASAAGPKSTTWSSAPKTQSGPLDFGVLLDPPPNDVCATAINIPCGNIDLSGNSGLAVNDYSPSDTVCTGYLATGGDVVYKMTVVAGDSLWLDYNTVFDGSVYIVTDCSNISGTCVFGRDSVNTAGIERVRYRFTAPGTYFVILDAFGTGGGAWTAAGQLVCGSTPLPPNDLCATATPLLCGPFSLSGSTQFAIDNYNFPSMASCTGQLASGRDVVYRINATAGDSLWMDYTTTTDGSLYVLSTCDGSPGACVVGTDSFGPGQTERLRYKFPFSGPYYVIIDSRATNSFGTWTATGAVECGLSVPSNDQCSGAITLECGDISLSGSTQLAANNYAFLSEFESCTDFLTDGHDVVYKVQAIQGDSLWLDYLSTTDGCLYVVTDCNDLVNSCVIGVDNNVEGEPEFLRFRFPTSATYYVILDSYALDSFGDWTATGGIHCGAVGVGPPRDPNALAFSGAYPNPFRATTALEYTLATAAHATLRVYDLQGRRVRLLFDGDRQAGEHRTVWDGRDDQGLAVGAGVYFAQLESDGRIAKRRLIFVR